MNSSELIALSGYLRDAADSMAKASEIVAAAEDAENTGRLSSGDICRAVANTFKISVGDMESHYRGSHLIKARHAALALMREHTTLSLPAIGRVLKRDHTSTIYAIKKIPSYMEEDEQFCRDYKLLNNYFQEKTCRVKATSPAHEH